MKAHENPLLSGRRCRDVWQRLLSVYREELHAAFPGRNASANSTSRSRKSLRLFLVEGPGACLKSAAREDTECLSGNSAGFPRDHRVAGAWIEPCIERRFSGWAHRRTYLQPAKVGTWGANVGTHGFCPTGPLSSNGQAALPNISLFANSRAPREARGDGGALWASVPAVELKTPCEKERQQSYVACPVGCCSPRPCARRGAR